MLFLTFMKYLLLGVWELQLHETENNRLQHQETENKPSFFLFVRFDNSFKNPLCSL